MAQGNIVAAQTPLLVSDFINMAKADDNSYAIGSPDFLTPFKVALPAYAKSYTGVYYQVSSQTSAPQQFPAAQLTTGYGSIYEIALPTNAIDGGINGLVISYNSSQIVPETSITNALETSWVMDNTNTTVAYWTQRGRVFRSYLPVAYKSSPAYSFDYQREPTYPQVTGDAIDAPADDIATLYNAWKSDIKIY